jgi:hypothetical protein
MVSVVYEGSCHCGAIGFRYHSARDPGSWSVRACQCAFCRAHQALSASDPEARIEFTAVRPALLSKYRFARHTADFLVCSQCGVYIGAMIETPRGRFGIININSFNPVPAKVAAPVPMEYGAESHEQRVARRELRWSQVSDASIQLP